MRFLQIYLRYAEYYKVGKKPFVPVTLAGHVIYKCKKNEQLLVNLFVSTILGLIWIVL